MRFFEPFWFEVTEKRVRLPYLKQPLKLLHLSDFHYSEEVPLETIEEAIDLGLQQKPDLVVVSGDFITWKIEDKTAYARILKKLSAAVPCFACAGNHDGGLWAGSSHGFRDLNQIRSMLESTGIQLLHNDSQTAIIRGQPITVVGLGDIWSREAKPQEVLSIKRQDNHPIIVLSHNPDSKELLKPYDWDLMCCGHTHGGQLVIPLLGIRPFLPVRDKSFAEGLLSWGDRHIHLTRGVGNLHGMRFNCLPEISILQLEA
jgi:uncharacterized protein